MGEGAVTRRLAAVLAADVVDFCQLVGRDEVGTLNAFAACCREVLDPAIARHSGRVVKLLGDCILAEFASVVEAVGAAVEIQNELAGRSGESDGGTAIRLRIGVNLCDVVVAGDDILGDGVNATFRLQALAEPGGTAVTREARDAVRDRLPIAFEGLGEVQVKNLARPLRVYRIVPKGALASRRSPAALWRRSIRRPSLFVGGALAVTFLAIALALWWPWQAVVAPAARTAAAGGEPSIAVLPFQDMSGNADAAYLGQGVAEDIITALASYPAIRVVSRMSSFAVDAPMSAQEIGKALDANYFVEGSVRRLGDQIRITAQLIDTSTGDHVWANSYDETGQDVLAMQADVAGRVHDALAGASGFISSAEIRRAWSKTPIDLQEYDYYVRGHAMFMNENFEDDPEACAIWREGLGRFPHSALLRAKLGFCFVRAIIDGISQDPAADLLELERLAAEVRAIPDKSRLATWVGRWLDTWVAFYREDWERVWTEAQATVRLAPGDAVALADLAYLVAWAGRPREALAWAEEAIERDPRSWLAQLNLGWVYYLCGRPQEAIDAVAPITSFEPMVRLVAYARLGRLADAQAARERFLAEVPGWTVTQEAALPTHPGLEAAYFDDLRKAGLPE